MKPTNPERTGPASHKTMQGRTAALGRLPKGAESLIRRLIVKAIVVFTFIVISIVVLAAIVVFGYFFLALAFPKRMSVTGRVTDIRGKPIRGVEVRAVPLPVYTPFLDHSMEPKDKEHIAVTDENGRFRFKGLVASGGVKEGMWVQEYDIVVKAEGYGLQKSRVRNDFESHEDVITLTDFVLEEEAADDKKESNLVGLLGKTSKDEEGTHIISEGRTGNEATWDYV